MSIPFAAVNQSLSIKIQHKMSYTLKGKSAITPFLQYYLQKRGNFTTKHHVTR